MTTPKINSLLYMFHRLLEKGYLKKGDTQSLLHMSDMSFRRYIRSIRDYLELYEKDRILVYRKREDVYWLKNAHCSADVARS